MQSMDFARELALLIQSRHSLIYIPTLEEERCEATIQAVARNLSPPRPSFCWDLIEGYLGHHAGLKDYNQALEAIGAGRGDVPSIYLLRDFHRAWNDDLILRKLKNLKATLAKEKRTIIMLGARNAVPPELNDDVAVLEFPLPSWDDVTAEVHHVVASVACNLTEYDIEALVAAGRGLVMSRLRGALMRSVAESGVLDHSTIACVLAEKRRALAIAGVADLPADTVGIDDVGGMLAVKNYLMDRRSAFTSEARVFGVAPPRGVALFGPAGTGKTLMARAMAGYWQIPLLILPPGRGYGADPEDRIHRLARVAEAMAPCVLLLDDVDVAFGPNGGLPDDGGASRRAWSAIAGWLQRKEAPVMLVATARDANQAPLDLVRRGLVDELFHVTPPTTRERREVLDLVLRKIRPREWDAFPTDLVAVNTANFTGADLRRLVEGALLRAFAEGREFAGEDLLMEVDRFARRDRDGFRWATIDTEEPVNIGAVSLKAPSTESSPRR
jgi:SpoVK/Ycf46/Vps4 family AAA+-type ATPase